MKKNIVVVGSCNTDLIANAPCIPRPGETVLGGKFFKAAGGKGANQAVAASRAGGRVAMIAAVGNDSFGKDAVSSLKAENIDITNVRIIEGSPSGVALIFVSEKGENSIVVAPGANAELASSHIEEAGPVIAAAEVVLLQLETPLATVMAAAELAAENGVTVILNPAPAMALPDELLRKVTILSPNETEAEALSGIAIKTVEDAALAAKKLYSSFGIAQIIITMGAKGVFWYNGKDSLLIPSFKVAAVVDTTAAGDTFNGALATALAEGQELKNAISFGCAAAALSVTKPGAQPSIPLRQDIAQIVGCRE